MEPHSFNRAAEDLGNITGFGHSNFCVPDQRLATLFYVTALGLTRDPAMMTGVDNMWINIGDAQFHLPTGDAVMAPGLITGLVMPDLEGLRGRLERARDLLAGTDFAFYEEDGAIEASCPWGNRFRCHAPDEARFGRRVLGIAYSDFEIPRGRAAAIARFYKEIMGAIAGVETGGGQTLARVSCGGRQHLIFRECADPKPPCALHHVQIYVADFSGPYERLGRTGLKIEENGQHQYRFFGMADALTREPLFTLDHEVRSMTHPMFGRPLVNRDPAQSARGYRAGGDFHH